MAVLGALRDGLLAPMRHRTVAVAAAITAALTMAFQAFGVVMDPQTVTDPGASVGQLNVLVVPFVVGGTIAVIHLALAGDDPDLDDYVAHGKRYYLGLLIAIYAFPLGLTVLWLIGMFATGILLAIAAAGGGSAAGGAVVIVAGAAFVIATLAYVALFQFFDVALVVDDEDIGDAFERSYRLARGAPVAVAGYTAAKLVLSALVFVPSLAYMVVWFLEQDLTVEGALATRMTFADLAIEMSTDPVLIAIGFAGNLVANLFLLPFHVSFYRRLVEAA